MKTLRLLFGLVLAFAAFAVLRAEPIPAMPAPAWKFTDLDGKVISADQFKGKVVVVDFWATWCGPCRTEIPGYIQLQNKYGKDGLVIIGVSCDQDKHAVQTVKNFVQKNGMTYQIVMSDDEMLAAFGGAEGIQAIPTTFIIDRQGQIRDRKTGAEPTSQYEKTILTYLK